MEGRGQALGKSLSAGFSKFKGDIARVGSEAFTNYKRFEPHLESAYAQYKKHAPAFEDAVGHYAGAEAKEAVGHVREGVAAGEDLYNHVKGGIAAGKKIVGSATKLGKIVKSKTTNKKK